MAGEELPTNSTRNCGFSKENPTKQLKKNTTNAHSKPKNGLCKSKSIPTLLWGGG